MTFARGVTCALYPASMPMLQLVRLFRTYLPANFFIANFPNTRICDNIRRLTFLYIDENDVSTPGP